MTDLQINGRDFRIERETVFGAQGFTVREWDSVPIGGRNILHELGCQTEREAIEIAHRIAREES